MAKIPDNQEEESTLHQHDWRISHYDTSEEICVSTKPKPCIKVRISTREEARRREEWDNYYELEQTTPSHLIFQQMKEAFKLGQMSKVQELHKELRSLGHPVKNPVTGEEQWEPNDLLPTPKQKDPINYPWLYVIEE